MVLLQIRGRRLSVFKFERSALRYVRVLSCVRRTYQGISLLTFLVLYMHIQIYRMCDYVQRALVALDSLAPTVTPKSTLLASRPAPLPLQHHQQRSRLHRKRTPTAPKRSYRREYLRTCGQRIRSARVFPLESTRYHQKKRLNSTAESQRSCSDNVRSRPALAIRRT